MIEKSFINNQLGIKFNSYIDHKCRFWFKVKEVAQILGYKNTDDAIKRHVSENHKRIFFSRCRPPVLRCKVIRDKKSCPRKTRVQVLGRWIVFIDEAGFYELVFKSRLPSAIIFREWVFTKVLPSIRKFGYYKLFKIEDKNRVINDGKKILQTPSV